jgi:hypothetical protein
VYELQQEVLGRTNRLISLIRHGTHRKRRIQQFFYCCVCIRYRSNVSTEPLPSNDRGIFTEPLSSNDKGILTEPLPSSDRGFLPSRWVETTGGFLPSSCLAMIRGLLPSRCLATIRGIHSHTRTHTQQRDLITQLLFFQNKESTLKSVGFEVFTAVVSKSIFFWDMTPCSAAPSLPQFRCNHCPTTSPHTQPRCQVYKHGPYIHMVCYKSEKKLRGTETIHP